MDTVDTTIRGLCTCHSPARPCTAPAPGEEFAHDDDEEFAETFHVHEDVYMTDCDGPTTYERTYQITSWIPDTGPLQDAHDLWQYMVRHAIGGHEDYVTLTLDAMLHTCEVAERHDEGVRNTTLRACRDVSCAHDEGTQRDFYAEAAGY